MDPNPKKFPLLSYVMAQFNQLSLKSSSDSATVSSTVDIEQSKHEDSQYLEVSADETSLVELMPHLTDPNVISSMRSAVTDVSQTRSVLQTLGDRPDHETVDIAREKIAEIDAKLSKDLEDLVRSPRPSEVDRMEWRAKQAVKEKECRREAEKQKQMYKAVVQVDEMHDGYEKLLKQAEERLVKIYESSTSDRQEGPAEESDVANDEVVGILQEALGEGIKRIDLSRRNLKFLPEAFGHLHGLVVLDLSNNMLKTIPDSIAGLENLEELYLPSNYLESLPDSVGLLLNLKILDVSRNQLTCLPDTICHCRSLVEIDASFNNITYLPTGIGCEMQDLERLFVELNKIRSLPTSICEMRSLRRLDIHFNELRGLPTGIGNLTNLEVLNLSSNFADLTELPVTIGYLTNLTELDLSNNQIRVLPDSIGRVENLNKLNLDGLPLMVPPMEVVAEGTEAVKTFMEKRWVDVLIEEEKRSTEAEESGQGGWITRGSSWLSNAVSGLSRTLSSSYRKGQIDPCLDQQL